MNVSNNWLYVMLAIIIMQNMRQLLIYRSLTQKFTEPLLQMILKEIKKKARRRLEKIKKKK
jgi:hypothetical protein